MNVAKSALFSLGFALLASTAHAQVSGDSVAGADGDGVVDRDLAPPPANLDAIKPIPPLVLKADEEVRSLPTDPEVLTRGFGAVRKTEGGGETQVDAPAEVRSAIEAADDAGAKADQAEWEPASDPLMEEDKVIVGPDDRIWVKTNSKYPFRAIGWLYMEKGNGGGSCSGALIGPRTVITAAHCVYDHDNGGWVDTVTFYPGANGKDFPYGGYKAQDYTILRGFMDNYQGYYGSVIPWDLAIVTLRQRAGDRVGTLGYEVNNQRGFTANLVGYPADKPRATMWRVSCEIDPLRMTPETFRHDCDTYSGSSGSSMYRYDKSSDKRFVNGVNVSGNAAGNFNTSVLLNSVYMRWVSSLRQ